MRDNKTLNKISMILRFIPLTLFVFVGIFILYVCVVSVLERYGVVSNTWQMIDFNWVGVVLMLIMAFCFIYFPISSMVGYVKSLKNNSLTREVTTCTIESQTEAVNMTDIAEEHNRRLRAKRKNKANSQVDKELMQNVTPEERRKQANLRKSNLKLAGLFIVSILFFSAAMVCIVPNSLTHRNVGGESSDSFDFWRIGTFILCFFPMLIMEIVSGLRMRSAIKHDKPIPISRFSTYYLALGILFPIVAGLFLFITDPEVLKSPGFIIFVSIVAFFCILIICGFVYDVITYNSRSKLLKDPMALKNKARYLGCKFSSSTDESVNGIPMSLGVKYKVRFAFTDENGVERTKVSSEKFTFKEVAYLKYKKEFDIVSRYDRVAIVEDLTNIELPENVDANTEQKISTMALPYFARKNRWRLIFTLGSVFAGILLVTGIGLLFIPNETRSAGIPCIIFGLVMLGLSMYFCLPSILAESKGKETYGKLIKLEVDYKMGDEHDTNRKYAVVEVDGNIKNIYLLFDEWYAILGEYVGKEIPLKVWRKTAVIDFQKMYSDLI